MVYVLYVPFPHHPTPHTLTPPVALLHFACIAWHGKGRPVRDQQKGTGSKGKEKTKNRKKKPTRLPFCPISNSHHHPTLPPHPFCRIERRLPLSLSSCACVSVMRAVGAVLEIDGKKTLRKFRPGSRFLALPCCWGLREEKHTTAIHRFFGLSLLDDSVTSRLPPTLPPVLWFWVFFFGSGGLDSGHSICTPARTGIALPVIPSGPDVSLVWFAITVALLGFPQCRACHDSEGPGSMSRSVMKAPAEI